MDDLDELLNGVSTTLPQLLPPTAYWESAARQKLDAAARPGELFLYYDPIGYREPHGVAMQREPIASAGVMAATDQRLLFATEYPQVPVLAFGWTDISQLEQEQRSWWQGGRKYMRDLTLTTNPGARYRWGVGTGLAETLVMQWSMRHTTKRTNAPSTDRSEQAGGSVRSPRDCIDVGVYAQLLRGRAAAGARLGEMTVEGTIEAREFPALVCYRMFSYLPALADPDAERAVAARAAFAGGYWMAREMLDATDGSFVYERVGTGEPDARTIRRINEFTSRFHPVLLLDDLGLNESVIAYTLRLAHVFTPAQREAEFEGLPEACFVGWAAGLATGVAEVETCGRPVADQRCGELDGPVIVDPQTAALNRALGVDIEAVPTDIGVEYIWTDEDLQHAALGDDPDELRSRLAAHRLAHAEEAADALLDELVESLEIDPAWTVREDRRMTWWSYALAQQFHVGEPLERGGELVAPVTVRTDLLRDIDPEHPVVGMLDSFNAHCSTSAWVHHPQRWRWDSNPRTGLCRPLPEPLGYATWSGA